MRYCFRVIINIFIDYKVSAKLIRYNLALITKQLNERS